MGGNPLASYLYLLKISIKKKIKKLKEKSKEIKYESIDVGFFPKTEPFSPLNFVKFSNPPSIITGDEGVIGVICTRVVLIFLWIYSSVYTKNVTISYKFSDHGESYCWKLLTECLVLSPVTSQT